MKLYRCEARIVYYCLAKDEKDAAEFAHDAAFDAIISDHVEANEVTKAPPLPDQGWDGMCLIYNHQNEDIELAAAIKDATDQTKRKAAPTD